MKKVFKIVGVIVFSLLLCITFFILGLRIGCHFSYKSPTVGDIGTKLGALKALRSKDYDIAIKLLDISLQGDVLMLKITKSDSNMSPDETNSKFIQGISPTISLGISIVKAKKRGHSELLRWTHGDDDHASGNNLCLN